MKKLIIILALLAGPALFRAQSAEVNPIPPEAQVDEIQKAKSSKEPLTKFNLDFKGGSPQDLVKAVEKGLGKHLNVIIPPDSKADQAVFPPLKLERVDVAQLFKAIGEASQRTARQIIGESAGSPFALKQTPRYAEYNWEYGFRSSSTGPLTDDTIWYFYNNLRDPLPEAGRTPQITCGYFQLADYLQNTTIDAITTAINTSFELLNETPPKMKFHPDTQLLIVAGTEGQIQNISNLLRLLPPPAKPRNNPIPSRRPQVTPAPIPAPVPTTPIEPANP